jgi:hypothetical protein
MLSTSKLFELKMGAIIRELALLIRKLDALIRKLEQLICKLMTTSANSTQKPACHSGKRVNFTIY